MENVNVIGMQTENDDVAVESRKDEKKNRKLSHRIDSETKSQEM